MKILADTNIFGIAVDKKDDRRESIWNTLEKVASGEIELSIAEIVKEEIKENPHEPTKQRELDLVKNMVSSVYSLNKKTRTLFKELEDKTSLDVFDAQIVSIAIVNDLIFWSGDRYILRKKTIDGINQVLKDKNYRFRYKKE